MPLYEHVFIARQDISGPQAESLIEHLGQIITDNGGKVVGTEYWGLKTLAYKINKNRKGHYGFIRSDAPAAAVHEMERLARLHEDIMRILTVRVDSHGEGPSAMMQPKSSRDDRRRRDDAA
ncbi:MAG: 30S ribosomal protein S6 [Paracoccaceae bacterium]|nr:MAG: 30S ribosomal protein S6 [Paracoccaceae bacterium]